VTLYFLDTSALIKRYIHEVGSVWTQSIIAPSAGNIIAISELARVEVAATLARRRRDGSLSAAAVSALYTAFLAHTQREYLMALLDSTLLTNAVVLADRHTLRTLDSIQLACALYTQLALQELLIFVCADTNLLSAATAEGLTTENPLNHP
jgi:uncharacterized protein